MVPTLLRRVGRNPFFNDLQRFQSEVNHLFNSPRQKSAQYPALRVYQNDDEALVEAKLPGVNPADIDLKVEDQVLSLSGQRPVEADQEGQTALRRERFSGRFERRLDLPFEVDADQVEATFKNGVLAIRLPKAAAHKPRQIEIKAS